MGRNQANLTKFAVYLRYRIGYHFRFENSIFDLSKINEECFSGMNLAETAKKSKKKQKIKILNWRVIK